jgi:hypothetical protein
MSTIIQKTTPEGKTITYRMEPEFDPDSGLNYYRYTVLDPTNSFQVVYENGNPLGFKTTSDYRQSGYVEIQQQRGGRRRIKSRRIKSRRRK